jgi:hypothetical protein
LWCGGSNFGHAVRKVLNIHRFKVEGGYGGNSICANFLRMCCQCSGVCNTAMPYMYENE